VFWRGSKGGVSDEATFAAIACRGWLGIHVPSLIFFVHFDFIPQPDRFLLWGCRDNAS